jgi:tetratricopeptide (TPR) repeat protein
MLPVFCRYLFNLVWPTNLSPFYSPAVKNNVDGEVASAGVLLFLAAILAFYLLRRQRHLSFWFLLFFIGLVPVSQGVPLITLMNDRYLYYPMAGAAVFMAFFPAALLTAPGGKWRIFGSLVVFLILPLSYLSLKQAEIWRDGVAFWSRAYEEAPESDRVRNGFADALFSKGMVLANGGRKDEALSYYLAVLKIDSFDQRTLNNIGELYTKRGELAEGRRYLLRMTKRYPWDLYGFLNLGDNFLGSGEMARAEESYRRAITIEPRSPLPWLGLGYIYRQIGKFDQANEYSRQAELRRNH